MRGLIAVSKLQEYFVSTYTSSKHEMLLLDYATTTKFTSEEVVDVVYNTLSTLSNMKDRSIIHTDFQ